MIYDVVLFDNEVELLELRLHELADTVDKFLIIEGNRLFSNFQHKESNFLANFDKYKDFQDKIHFEFVTDLPCGFGYSQWCRERHQRYVGGLRALKAVSLQDHDIVIMNDADEIPRSELFREYNPLLGTQAVGMNWYYYYLNLKVYQPTWSSARIMSGRDAKLLDPKIELRMEKFAVIPNGGWHFSYQGGVDRIVHKMESYGHQDKNRPTYKDRNYLTKAMEYGIDYEWPPTVRMMFTDIDNTYPEYVQKNCQKYLDMNWIKKI